MKIILQDITGAYNLSSLNSNFQKIQEAINDKILFRENIDGEDNALKTDIDVNQKRLFNLPEPIGDDEPMRKGDVTTILTQIQEYADNVFEQGAEIVQNAQAVAASAQASATDASESATEASDAAALAVSVSANVQEVMDNAAAEAAVAVRDEVKDDADRAQQAAVDAQNAASGISLPIPITSGGTGGDSLAQAKTNLGINNVDNTRDLDKPVSNAVLSLISSLNISPAPNLLYNGSFLYNKIGTVYNEAYFGSNSRTFIVPATGALPETEVISGWSYKDNKTSRGSMSFSTRPLGTEGRWGLEIAFNGGGNTDANLYRVLGVGIPFGFKQAQSQTFTLTGRFRRGGYGGERRLFASLYDPGSNFTSLQVINMSVDGVWTSFRVVFTMSNNFGELPTPAGLNLRFTLGAGSNYAGNIGQNLGKNVLYSGAQVSWEDINNVYFELTDLKLEEGSTNTVPMIGNYSEAVAKCSSRYQTQFIGYTRPNALSSGGSFIVPIAYMMEKVPTVSVAGTVSGNAKFAVVPHLIESTGGYLHVTATEAVPAGTTEWGCVIDARHPLVF